MTINNRLLAVGCSFTRYHWSTWADYLGQHFDSFNNRGVPGTDNATIARIVTAFAEPGDTVAVMWTSYQRYCYKISRLDTYNWSSNHSGMTQAIADKKYFADIFNPYERLLTTINNIEWVCADSKSRNYTVHHFCAFPMLEGDLNLSLSNDMIELVKEKQFYFDLITQPSLFDFAIGKPCEPGDNHPTTETHQEFYQSVVCPKLGFVPLQVSF